METITTVNDAVDVPAQPGASTKLTPGPQLRRYMLWYSIASIGIALIWSGIGGIIMPEHVQQIEYNEVFTGQDSGVNLQQLENLKAEVDQGKVTPNADQQRQLKELNTYESGKASKLSMTDSIGVAFTMLVQPLIGMLSDRTRSKWGRRAPWIAGGAVLGTGLFIGMRFSMTIGILIVLWTAAQIGVNAASGPLYATVADRVPQERVASVSAVTGMCSSLGGTLGSLAAGSMFAMMGLNVYFPFLALFMLFMLAFVFFTRDQPSKEMQPEPLRLKQVIKSYGYAFRFRDYRWAWIAKSVLWLGYGISTMYSIYMLQSYIQPALSASQAAQVAPLISTITIPFNLLAMLVAGRWSDKIRRRKPFVVASSVIMACSFLIPFAWPALPAMFIQGIVAGIGMGAFQVVDQALFIDVLPEADAAGRDLGLAALGQNLGQALGPVIAGVVVTMAAGSYGPIWLTAFLIVLVAAFAVLPIKGVR